MLELRLLQSHSRLTYAYNTYNITSHHIKEDRM